MASADKELRITVQSNTATAINEPFGENETNVGSPLIISYDVSAEQYKPDLPFYQMSIDEVKQRCCLQTLVKGIPEQRVEDHRKILGDNLIPMSDGPSIIKMLIGHFFNSLTFILGFVVVISGILQDWAEFGVVLFVIIFNGALGFYQEFSAEKSLQSLKDMTKGVAKVVRGGETKVIPIDDVVVGDLVVLEQGTSVPADLRIIESNNLEIDEGMLTGESLPVAKHVNPIEDPDGNCALGDRKNLAYRQTNVTAGRGRGIACTTGTHTQMGKLAQTLTDDTGSNETPLQRKLKIMMWSLFGSCVVLVLIVFAANSWAFESEVILYACSVSIAMIPEALTVVVTVAMSVSVYRMAQYKCIVRKLASLEVLGNVTDICSDKTGTLTENKMVTSRIVLGLSEPIELSGAPFAVHGTFTRNDDLISVVSDQGLIAAFMKSCALCSSTHMKQKADDPSMLVGTGNPTEIAIQVMTWKAKANRDRFISKGWTKVGEFPFDSAIKRMSVAYANTNDDSIYFCSKGAPERMLALCNWYMKHDGTVSPMTEKEKEHISMHIHFLAHLALRTICVTHRKLKGDEFKFGDDVSKMPRDDLEQDLVYLGLVGIYDPPRPESRPSVMICQHAGIKVRMLTGDHTGTARAIAEKLNIVNAQTGGGELSVIAGPDFDKFTDEQADSLEDLPSVVGRCSPESKVKMIKALHRRGRVVAMTGDGFNDSPSIKISDIGCAMGSGTDVTKGVADLVITDDNFATIVKAVAEGRRISGAIKKFVIHLLSSNVAEVIALILGLPIMLEGRSVFVLSPIEILWLNMFTGSPPATGLSLDEADPETLHVPPNTDGFFTKELMLDTVMYGTFLGINVLMAFIYVIYGGNNGLEGRNCNKTSGEGCEVIWSARAAAFTVLYLGLLIHAYNVRNTRKSIFKMKWFDNNWLWGSVLFGVVTLIPILYVEQIATNVFIHRRITWEWAVVLIGLIAFVIMSEVYKIVKNLVDPIPVIHIPDEEQQVDVIFSAQMSARDNRSLQDVVHDNLAQSFTMMRDLAEDQDISEAGSIMSAH